MWSISYLGNTIVVFMVMSGIVFIIVYMKAFLLLDEKVWEKYEIYHTAYIVIYFTAYLIRYLLLWSTLRVFGFVDTCYQHIFIVIAWHDIWPVLVLVGGDGQDARAIHGSSRSATVHPSAFVLNGQRLVVVATLGWRNGPLLSMRSDDDDDDDDICVCWVHHNDNRWAYTTRSLPLMYVDVIWCNNPSWVW